MHRFIPIPDVAAILFAFALAVLWQPDRACAQQPNAINPTEHPLASLKGGTLEAMLKLGLVKSGIEETMAAELASGISITQVKSLTETLGSLQAVAVRSGKERRTINVKILVHNLQETPGCSDAAMEPLMRGLSDGSPVVADLMRNSWRVRNGEFPDEAGKSRKGVSDRNQFQRVLLANDSKQNAVICRLEDGSKGKIARISQSELKAALCSYAVVQVQAAGDASKPESFPKDFRFDRTLIKPGHYAYLSVPYQGQGKGAICSAAAALNVLHFIDPKLNLEQREVLAIYNGHTSMATQQQMVVGIRNLGYEAVLEQPREQEKVPLMAKVRTSLDEGRPMIVTTAKHALTVIGYNKSKGTLIYWDQASPKPGNPEGLPMGAVEANEDSLRARMNYIIYVNKLADGTLPSAGETSQLAKLTGKQDFLRHQLTNANPKLAFSVYLGHAIVPKFRNLHQRGRTVLVPYHDKDVEFLEIIGEMDSKWLIVAQPSGKEINVTEPRLIKAIEQSHGVIFSRPVE
jgi:hypothetical protein